jgi:outer membrane protein
LWVSLRQANISVAQARAELLDARQDLIVRVAEAYFSVLFSEDNLEFATGEKDATARQLERAHEFFEVGLIAITDVKQSQASYDSAVAQEIAAVNELDISREELQVITGQYMKKLNKLSVRMPLVAPEPQDISQWVETALGQNLRLRAAALASAIAEQEIKRQRAGHYPTLDLFGARSVTDNAGGLRGDSDTTDTTVGLKLNFPIFSGGRVSSRTRQARYDFQEAVDNLSGQRRETVRETRASYLKVNSGISQVKALKQALESTQTAAEATQAEFDVGTRTAVDVLLGLRDTFRSEREYSRARYDYILATLRLKRAAGILSDADVWEVNSWLD